MPVDSGANASTSSSSTETKRETPLVCMVTPNRASQALMVPLLWVTTTNCDVSRNDSSIARKRSTLASSSAASTSSRMQKGLGRLWNTAKSRARAVMVR